MPETQTPPPPDAPELTELQQRVQSLEGELAQANQTIVQLERRAQIDALLRESEAIDLEAARLLTEVAVASMAEPDVQAAVSDLRRRRPYLFRNRGPGALAMSAQANDDPADDAGQRAAQTGSRRDLLRYLRLRRTN